MKQLSFKITYVEPVEGCPIMNIDYADLYKDKFKNITLINDDAINMEKALLNAVENMQVPSSNSNHNLPLPTAIAVGNLVDAGKNIISEIILHNEEIENLRINPPTYGEIIIDLFKLGKEDYDIGYKHVYIYPTKEIARYKPLVVSKDFWEKKYEFI